MDSGAVFWYDKEMHPFLLTAAEQEVFLRLPKALRANMPVYTETLNRYETDDELRMRYDMANFAKYPEIEAMAKGEMDVRADAPWLDAMPPSDLLFAIGARGVSLLIAGLLRTAATEDDMGLLLDLAEVRHALLETNQRVDHDIPPNA